MSDETTTPETPEVPTYPTAFLMVQEADGAWRVTTDLTTQFQVAKIATRLDIRLGCQEITNIINQQDIAANVVTLLAQNFSANAPQTDAE